MKIVVFGATGGTGREVVAQALAAGHEVTAVARDPSRLGPARDRLRAARVALGDADSLDRGIAGQDVVLSALGLPGLRASLRPMDFYRSSAEAITAAMRRCGVRRFVGITSEGVADSRTTPLLYRWVLKPILRHKYEDMGRMEEAIRASGLDWVIVRPSGLTDGPHTGRYRIGERGSLPHAARISRADVADCMVRMATADEYLKSTIAVSY